MTHSTDSPERELALRPTHTERFAVASTTAAVVAVVIAAVALYYGHQADGRSQRASAARSQAVSALSTANSSLAQNGLAPVPTPTGVASPAPTVTVTQAVKAPSDEQVQDAVDSYCAAHRCAASGPTPAQVVAAVATYCNTAGQCQGAAGASGSPGPPGPGPTADQLATAVGDYCASHNQCAGPAGQDASPDQIAAAVSDYCSANDGCRGSNATPQPFHWTFTVPGDGLTVPDRTYTITCTWDSVSGYTCSTKKES